MTEKTETTKYVVLDAKMRPIMLYASGKWQSLGTDKTIPENWVAPNVELVELLTDIKAELQGIRLALLRRPHQRQEPSRSVYDDYRRPPHERWRSRL
jgi:hypothetical protein